MYKIRFLWRKIIALFSSLIGLNILTSCKDAPQDATETAKVIPEEVPCLYGMPPDYGEITGIVTGDSDGDGIEEPLENVKIYEKVKTNSTSESETEESYLTKTDIGGYFRIDRYDKGEYIFKFVDGDGSENRLFKSKEETISYNGSDMTHDVSLELDDMQTDSTSETADTTDTTDTTETAETTGQ
ncbi:MAG: hypothetical protein IKP49_09365 [Treponema sp.]|nr:hypothetical protein [Treponema sp.]